MVKEISSFDLEILSKAFDIRIWYCEKIGRRWSFICGAGEQKVLPSELFWENEDSAIFVQGEGYNQVELLSKIEELLTRVV